DVIPTLKGKCAGPAHVSIHRGNEAPPVNGTAPASVTSTAPIKPKPTRSAITFWKRASFDEYRGTTLSASAGDGGTLRSLVRRAIPGVTSRTMIQVPRPFGRLD